MATKKTNVIPRVPLQLTLKAPKRTAATAGVTGPKMQPITRGSGTQGGGKGGSNGGSK